MIQFSNLNKPNLNITNNTHLTVNKKTLQLKLPKSNDSFLDNITSPEQHPIVSILKNQSSRSSVNPPHLQQKSLLSSLPPSTPSRATDAIFSLQKRHRNCSPHKANGWSFVNDK